MTIYALSTGPGVAGIAIIRISGPESSKVVKSITGKELPMNIQLVAQFTGIAILGIIMVIAFYNDFIRIFS